MHCQPCKEQNRFSEACYWCQDCSEALCNTCSASHKAFKLSKNHVVSRYEDHKTLIESNISTSDRYFPVDGFDFCTDHPDRNLKYFCKSHEKPICLICKRQYHREACDVEYIEDAITETSINSASKRVLSSLDEQIVSYNVIKSQKESDLKQDTAVFEVALLSLQETREQIIVCLDDLSQDVRQKIEQERDLKLTPLKNDVQNLTVSLEKLSGYKNEILTILNNENLDRTKRYFRLISMESFCSGLNPRESVSKSLQYVTIPKLEYRKLQNGIEISIINKESQDKRLVGTKIETQEVGSSVVELEEVLQTRPETKHILKDPVLASQHADTAAKPKNLGSSKPQEYKTNSGGQRSFRLKFSFQIEGSERRTKITDIKLMPNKFDIAIAQSFRQRVWLYTKLGQKKGYLNLGGDTDSIAVIDDRRIAISLNHKHEIAVIDLYSMVRMKTIRTGFDVMGLAYLNGNLYANYCNSALICMTLSGIEFWADKSFKGELYFFMNNDGNIFSAEMHRKDIVAYNINTKKRKNYLLSGLERPIGITKDKEGKILVSCKKSSKIFSKSSFFAPATVLLDSSDGINSPWSIDYDDTNNELLVVNGGSDIVIFAKASI